MKSFLIFIAILTLLSYTEQKAYKVPVYAWVSGPGNATDEELRVHFTDLKGKGIDGLMYNGGQNADAYRRIGKIAKQTGLEFHAWIPTLMQRENPKLKPEWYVVNGLGESTWDKPAYVNYYKVLCPNHEEVYEFLAEIYGAVAEVDDVDGIHLDYTRFPDVILGKGLWSKYGLVMDREYPQTIIAIAINVSLISKPKREMILIALKTPHR